MGGSSARVLTAAPTLAVAVALTGCSMFGGLSGAVTVPPWQSPGDASVTEELCVDLIDELPNQVSDAIARPVESVSPAAAWGAPPVILRCGVEVPQRPLDAQLLAVDGVDWYIEEATGGVIASTVGREIVIEVAIPDDYDPPSEVLVAVATAIRTTIPLAAP